MISELQTIGAIINSAAINLGMYIAGRVLMGVGISMALTIAPTLLQEFAHPRYRAQIGSMCKCDGSYNGINLWLLTDMH